LSEREKNDPDIKTILIAEDDFVSRKIVNKYLTEKGYKIINASNGLEALTLYQKENPHLILMDIRMPEVDGFTATKMIRDHEKQTGVHIPIIAVTAFAIQGDREKCLEAGMDEYFSKPVDLSKLIEMIEKILT